MPRLTRFEYEQYPAQFGSIIIGKTQMKGVNMLIVNRSLPIWIFLSLISVVIGVQAQAMPLVTVYHEGEKDLWMSDLPPGSIGTEIFDDANLNPHITFCSDLGGKVNEGEQLFQDIVYKNDSVVESTIWKFAVPIRGFGGDWDLNPYGFGPGAGLTFTFYGFGGSHHVSEVLPNFYSGQFFGFISDIPFSVVEVISDGQIGKLQIYTLDNLVFAPVPEPTTYLLMGFGLMGFAAYRQRCNWWSSNKG